MSKISEELQKNISLLSKSKTIHNKGNESCESKFNIQ